MLRPQIPCALDQLGCGASTRHRMRVARPPLCAKRREAPGSAILLKELSSSIRTVFNQKERMIRFYAIPATPSEGRRSAAQRRANRRHAKRRKQETYAHFPYFISSIRPPRRRVNQVDHPMSPPEKVYPDFAAEK